MCNRPSERGSTIEIAFIASPIHGITRSVVGRRGQLALRVRGLSAARSRVLGLFIGKTSTKEVRPAVALVSSATRPPRSSAIRRTTARPRPVPDARVVKNGSNTREAISGATLSPSFATRV